MINVDENLHELVKHGTPDFPFSIYQDTYSIFKDKYYYTHYHEEYEIIIAYKGSISVVVNNNTYTLNEHELLLINANMFHRIDHTNYPDSKASAIVFNRRLLELNKGSFIEVNIINELFNRKFEAIKINNKEYYNELIKNEDAIRNKEKGYQLIVLILLYKLILYIYQSYETLDIKSSQSKNDDRIRLAIDYINKNYDSYITLEDIAKASNMSTALISKLFKKTVGQAPIDYLLTYRIKTASLLLENTNMKITDIATSTGFFSSNYFTIQFKKITGITPREYRNKKQRTSIL